jgi:hypothetical protein
VSPHQHRRVAAVASKEFEQTSADGDVRLLLLPRAVATATQRADEGLRLELAEVYVDARRLQRREVGDLPGYGGGMAGLAMMRDGGEVVDGRDRAAPGQGVNVRSTEARNVEGAE